MPSLVSALQRHCGRGDRSRGYGGSLASGAPQHPVGGGPGTQPPGLLDAWPPPASGARVPSLCDPSCPSFRGLGSQQGLSCAFLSLLRDVCPSSRAEPLPPPLCFRRAREQCSSLQGRSHQSSFITTAPSAPAPGDGVAGTHGRPLAQLAPLCQPPSGAPRPALAPSRSLGGAQPMTFRRGSDPGSGSEPLTGARGPSPWARCPDESEDRAQRGSSLEMGVLCRHHLFLSQIWRVISSPRS